MGLVIRLIELLIILVPLAGAIIAGMRALSKVRAAEPAGDGRDVRRRVITRALGEHDRTDTRWLEYELDVARLLDFPLMTDLREPPTERFHRAKVRADLLRPARVDDLVDDPAAADRYVEAVENYVTAFDAAEAEAIRKRRNDFSVDEQQRMARAQTMLRLATDPAATPQERGHAYTQARRELDGLVVLPQRARAAIERGIAGELGS